MGYSDTGIILLRDTKKRREMDQSGTDRHSIYAASLGIYQDPHCAVYTDLYAYYRLSIGLVISLRLIYVYRKICRFSKHTLVWSPVDLLSLILT
jgi:hypothetical protein